MNQDRTGRPAGFDADAIVATIDRALASAGLDTASPLMRGVQQTIQRALHGGAPVQPPGQGRAAPPVAPGRVLRGEHRHRAGARAWRLYVPAQAAAAPRPLVVMLHGCTQSADDFALGTGMDVQAERHGCLVLYPEQAPSANPSKCWNWFQPGDQRRDTGEPALIASLVQEVLAAHDGDARRVFVAGLSAGAAMAVVLGESHPDVFAAVGAHSGLPYAAAHDVGSALQAMKGGRGRAGPAAGPAPATARARQALRTIVFHGDRDHTVQHENGVQIVQQALAAQAGQHPQQPLRRLTRQARSAGGRACTVDAHVDAEGRPWVEHWTLHGAGHAWAGGQPGGSHVDPAGPDASAEMLRFFLQH